MVTVSSCLADRRLLLIRAAVCMLCLFEILLVQVQPSSHLSPDNLDSSSVDEPRPSMPNRPPPQRAAETSALIGAWGPLYLGRRLHLKEWDAVASAVNAHRAAAGRRFNRTRAQCQSRVQYLKARYRKVLLSKRPPSGWRHFPHLRAFLASPADGPPPGFPAKAPASVKVEEEEEREEVVSGSGLAASWTVPTRPRSGAAGSCAAAAVITKLAGVYESLELARLDLEEKMETETEILLGRRVKVEK
ncbi:uncharacterized protein LOC133916316 [Phragmites australis]|uniref:uncharacterized protein LOC133916316 n=1 Tax=Phragmites australis TaxID=29695 RepID=UPI002D77C6C5|nr:uncharacterized protein LOC133916316 [Phragmites australis]